MNSPPPNNNPPPNNPRARLQALLAIPERDRTEEQWDELNELEIMMASGNRKVEAAHNQGVRDPNQRDSQPPGRPKQNGAPDNRKQGRKFHKRPPRRKGP